MKRLLMVALTVSALLLLAAPALAQGSPVDNGGQLPGEITRPAAPEGPRAVGPAGEARPLRAAPGAVTPAARSRLPVTGFDLALGIGVAAGLLAAGTGAVVYSRRRSRTQA